MSMQERVVVKGLDTSITRYLIGTSGTTSNFQNRGIIPRAIADVYEGIRDRHESDITVRISYLEIYREKMYDLLSTLSPNVGSNDLVITEDVQGKAYVKGLVCHHAQTEEEALNLLFEGESNRIISHHQLNRKSSRSHCIFTIYIESHSRTQSNTKFTTSKFNFVDLAGSERLGKTLSQGRTSDEALYINKSLTFLEQTIIALEDKKRHHVPYRQSKLTHVLKDTIGGRCNTVMLGNIWGEEAQMEETLSTLRFAARVMKVPSQPSINSHHDPVLLCKQYEQEIVALRRELAMYDTLTNRTQVNYEPLSDVQIKDIQTQIRKYIDNDLPEMDIVNLRQVKEVFEQFKQIIITMKATMENKLNDKHSAGATHEKGDTNEKAMENMHQTSEKSEKTGLVGDTDGNGFGIGRTSGNVKAAMPSAIANARKKNKKTKDVHDNERRISPPASLLMQGDQKVAQVESQSLSAIEILHERANTPPPKEDAFEMFKTDQGKRLNTLFLENKEILNKKKLEAKSISYTINTAKRDIDITREIISELERAKDSNEEVSRDGDIILDEGEFQSLQKLKELKKIYRVNYEHLQNVKSDIVYCEKLVKQCRQKLLLEFDTWYKESFGDAETGHDSIQLVRQEPSKPYSKEDNGEKFDRVQQELLMKHPESVAFYNARIQTDRRKLFTSSLKKRPGSVTTSLRNEPPKTMIMQ